MSQGSLTKAFQHGIGGDGPSDARFAEPSIARPGWWFCDVPPRESGDPFDLEVAKPHAIGIERRYQLLGKKVPAQGASLTATVRR